MIILNCNSLIHPSESIRQSFINLCNIELYRLQNDNSLGLSQLIDKYSLNDIKSSFEDCYILNGILQIPEGTTSSIILRYLECGGEGIRPCYFLTNVKNKLYKMYFIE